MQFLIILILLFAPTHCYEDKYLTQLVYKYIYNNEKLCGDPFQEPDWLPAMGECTVNCEPTQYICLISTIDNNEQKCRELSFECTTNIRKYLGWTPMQITTSTITPFPDSIVKEKSDLQTLELIDETTHSNIRQNAQYAVKSLEPMTAIINDYLITSSSSKTSDGNLLTPTLTVPVSSASDNNPPKEKFRKPVHNVLNYVPLNNNNVAEKYIPNWGTTTKGPIHPTDRFVTSQQLFDRMEEEQKNAANMAYGNRNSFVLSDTLDNEPIFGTPMMPSFSPPKEGLPMVGTRIEIVPPFPPTDPPITVTPLNGYNANTLPEANFKDLSANCCEWALNGLCDRSWKKVRKLCPKSCGSMICEDVEGIPSCTRAVDVDVEQCYQTVRMARYFGVKNVQVEETKTVVEPSTNEKTKNKRRKKAKKSKRRKMKKRKLRV